jgi:cytochrome bd-type quinol oxidase subunit 2
MLYPTRSWLPVLAALVVVLNLVDAVFTLVYTHGGVAVESNPLMRGVLESHPVLFMAAKLALVSLGVLLLWRLRHRGAAVVGLVATSTTYVGLVLYHLSAVPQLAVIASST